MLPTTITQLDKQVLGEVRAAINAAIQNIHPDLDVQLTSGSFDPTQCTWKLVAKVKGVKQVKDLRKESELKMFARVYSLDLDKVVSRIGMTTGPWKLSHFESKKPKYSVAIKHQITGKVMLITRDLAKLHFGTPPLSQKVVS